MVVELRETRLTPQTRAVLGALLGAGTWMYVRQVAEVTGLGGGSVQPILKRLERCGWVVSRWERVVSLRDLGRPARHYYRFSDQGLAQYLQSGDGE